MTLLKDDGKTMKWRNHNWIVWIPAFVIIGLIVYFDLQSPETTIKQTQVVQKKMVDVALVVNRKAVNSFWILNKQFIRKGAHFIEYFCLGVSISGALFKIRKEKYKIKESIFLCFLISLGDQLFKLWLPTREFDFIDMIIDFCGYFVGIYLFCIMNAGIEKWKRYKR